MKVRMSQDKQAAPDGIKVLDLEKGKTYDLPDHMAKVFISQKLATAAKGEKAPEEEPEPPEEKVEKPPETKVIEPPETKVLEPPEAKDEKPGEDKKEEEKKDEKPPEAEKKDKK